jgi:RNA polymerase sigma-70 factor (ECF subfamily)
MQDRAAAIPLGAGEEDADLMRAIALGDQAAFRRLVRRHLPATVRLAARILGNPSEAEDVAQEALIRVWKHAENFEAPESRGARFTTWLHRIVVNLCIDLRRRKAFEPLDDVAEPISAEEGAEDRMIAAEKRARVGAALGKLPERQRAAFVLCFYEERSNAEAARIMGIGVKALESLLVRARRGLRDALGTERSTV